MDSVLSSEKMSSLEEICEDAFEARLNWIDVLNQVTASQKTIVQATAFAKRHKHVEEELFDCLLDEMGKASLSQRLNLLTLLDTMAADSQRQEGMDAYYVKMIKARFDEIMITAMPKSNPKADVNRPVVRRVR